ncbi:fumarylacetoacetate hydrolase family protein [Salibacterium qingdaonense]|uniref:5-carboxy-2-oxohept-3-enedioate decarboxylase HpaG1 subunit n=1 Tax=Salibacterium qingdaonense TaxID=266892 RepID=A0A1I4HYH4_9BACI|nr:fumarylacetoacetate hydrolase family protein [Salibacterium qingdaonense]SFL47192.1 5-carboxy-2-oxohept-3-enedioate decarboxylase HpaG1 subunit [Salibacterium qingdaonense]
MATAKGLYNEKIYPVPMDVQPETNDVRGLPDNNVTWRVPVNGTVYGAALNYREELDELGDALHEKPYNKPPEAPVLYIKPVNTLNPHQHPVPMPADENELQTGASLGIVIGKTAVQVNPGDAWEYIEGFTAANDISLPFESFHRPPIKQKARDKFCPVGPWIVDKADVPDPDQLTIETKVNSETKQKASTAGLVRSIPRLLADVTEFMTLYEGDVLLTGTPARPPHVQKGDHVQVTIEQIGTLENTIQ